MGCSEVSSEGECDAVRAMVDEAIQHASSLVPLARDDPRAEEAIERQHELAATSVVLYPDCFDADTVARMRALLDE